MRRMCITLTQSYCFYFVVFIILLLLEPLSCDLWCVCPALITCIIFPSEASLSVGWSRHQVMTRILDFESFLKILFKWKQYGLRRERWVWLKETWLSLSLGGGVQGKAWNSWEFIGQTLMTRFACSWILLLLFLLRLISYSLYKLTCIPEIPV